MRALDQIVAILDNHNDSLRKVATELRRQADAIQEGSARIGEERPRSSRGPQVWSSRQVRSNGLLRHSNEAASLEFKTKSLEQARAGLEQKLEEEAKSFEVKLRDANLAHESRIAAAMAAQEAALTAELLLTRSRSLVCLQIWKPFTRR